MWTCIFFTFLAVALYAMLVIVILQISKAHDTTTECHKELRILEANVPTSATEVSSQICCCCSGNTSVPHTASSPVCTHVLQC